MNAKMHCTRSFCCWHVLYGWDRIWCFLLRFPELLRISTRRRTIFLCEKSDSFVLLHSTYLEISQSRLLSIQNRVNELKSKLESNDGNRSVKTVCLLHILTNIFSINDEDVSEGISSVDSEDENEDYDEESRVESEDDN